MPWGISDGDDVNSTQLLLYEHALGDGNPAQPATYTIFYNSDDAEYQARNGTDGTIDANDTDIGTVLTDTIAALGTSKGDIFLNVGAVSTAITVTLGNYVNVRGRGWRTIWTYTGTGVAFEFEGSESKLSDLRIDLSGTGSTGISMIDENNQKNTLNHVYVRGTGATDGRIGVQLGGSAGTGNAWWTTIFDCYFLNIQTGIKLVAGASYNPNANHIALTRFMSGTGTCVDIDAGTDTVLSDCWFENGTANGIGVDSAQRVWLYGCWWDMTGAGSNCLKSAGASADFRVFGGRMSSVGSIVDLTAGGSIKARDVIGYITENSGSDSIANGTTSKVVAHGLGVTPSAEHFTITGKEDPTNSVGTIWVDTIGSANFTVNVENDPGASNWDFGWHVRVN